MGTVGWTGGRRDSWSEESRWRCGSGWSGPMELGLEWRIERVGFGPGGAGGTGAQGGLVVAVLGMRVGVSGLRREVQGSAPGLGVAA